MNPLQILLAVIVLTVVVLGYYLISPLFTSIKANEALPEVITDDVGAGEFFETAATGVPVVGTDGHSASGTVRVVDAGGKIYIRYENFKTINGPDIFVYLAKDLRAEEFVNLGRVKATEGNVNYEVPAGVNLADYPYVLTWCRAFNALFNYATLR